MKAFTPHRTPNPNSLKVTTDRGPFIESGMESFRDAHTARAHPLAAALFAIHGVVDVFMVPGFVTVTKHPDIDWDRVWPEVTRALETVMPG